MIGNIKIKREGENVDSTQNIISFCTGYGGLDELGLRRSGVDVRVLCYLEIEVYVQALLVKAMEEGRICSAPIWTNAKTFDAQPFRGLVDGITGGFPCQPFSSAGKRKGKEDPRHLWPSIADAIRVCKPSWIFLENVLGLVAIGLRDVLQDLGRMGYRTTFGIFSAEEVGAPHQRKRVYILAYNKISGTWKDNERVWSGSCGVSGGQKADRKEMADCNYRGLCANEICELHNHEWPAQWNNFNGCNCWPSRPGQPQHKWEPPRTIKSLVGRNSHGLTHRVDRLRLLGNGVVPQTAELAWKSLWRKING
jgi:DNA (cytosine-5)-methyltransferase 1